MFRTRWPSLLHRVACITILCTSLSNSEHENSLLYLFLTATHLWTSSYIWGAVTQVDYDIPLFKSKMVIYAYILNIYNNLFLQFTFYIHFISSSINLRTPYISIVIVILFNILFPSFFYSLFLGMRIFSICNKVHLVCFENNLCGEFLDSYSLGKQGRAPTRPTTKILGVLGINLQNLRSYRTCTNNDSLAK